MRLRWKFQSNQRVHFFRSQIFHIWIMKINFSIISITTTYTNMFIEIKQIFTSWRLKEGETIKVPIKELWREERKLSRNSIIYRENELSLRLLETFQEIIWNKWSLPLIGPFWNTSKQCGSYTYYTVI